MPISTGFNYVQAISNAQEIPVSSQGGPGESPVEMPPVFSVEEPADSLPYVKRNTSGEKPSVETAYVGFSKVFTIWRPWEKCERCQTLLASGQATLPMLDGDHECPHTLGEEYKALLDSALRGDCIISRQEVFQTPEARCVHMEWMQVDPREAKRIKDREEQRAKNRVWPPNVEAAFSKSE